MRTCRHNPLRVECLDIAQMSRPPLTCAGGSKLRGIGVMTREQHDALVRHPQRTQLLHHRRERRSTQAWTFIDNEEPVRRSPANLVFYSLRKTHRPVERVTARTYGESPYRTGQRLSDNSGQRSPNRADTDDGAGLRSHLANEPQGRVTILLRIQSVEGEALRRANPQLRRQFRGERVNDVIEFGTQSVDGSGLPLPEPDQPLGSGQLPDFAQQPLRADRLFALGVNDHRA